MPLLSTACHYGAADDSGFFVSVSLLRREGIAISMLSLRNLYAFIVQCLCYCSAITMLLCCNVYALRLWRRKNPAPHTLPPFCLP